MGMINTAAPPFTFPARNLLSCQFMGMQDKFKVAEGLARACACSCLTIAVRF